MSWTGDVGRLGWLLALQAPEVAVHWTLAEWERVVRLARRGRLLARLAHRLEDAGLTGALPTAVQQHLLGEQRLSAARTTAVVWTIERIGAALAGQGFPMVLLKGAAYIGQDLPIARGRLPSDLDVLVPRSALQACQAALQAAGWQEVEMDAHDRAHYHEWSHEVPPMQHPLFEVELDLHHNILAPQHGRFLQVDLLLPHLQPSRWAGWQVLQPVDQVLHSAAHLFNDSELRDRVRDLVDLDGLFRSFGQSPGFWPALVARSRELGLELQLALALQLTVRWLQAPVPASALAETWGAGLGAVWRQSLLWLFGQALLPVEPDERPALRQRMAAWVLFVRYHLRRLPLRRLLPHVWHKLRSAVAPAA